MSDHVKLKNVQLDKTVHTAFKTSKGIMQGSKTLIKSEAQMFTNFTEDFYDELDDVSAGIVKESTADSVYGVRNAYRLGRSGINVIRKHHARHTYYKSYVEAEEKRKKEEAKKKREKQKNQNESVDPISSHGDEDITESDGKESYKDSGFYKNARSSWKNQTKEEKQAYYKQVKPKMKQGFSPRSSTKKTISNQARKFESKLNSRDDISDHIIASTTKGIRYTKRTIRTGLRLIKNFIPAMIHLFQGIISFVISIPSLIVGLLSMLPVILVFIIAICLIMIICSFEYSGRVISFVENEVYYEYRYDTNVVPDEVLSITSALGWTTENKEEYEALFALLDNAKDEETWILNYDDMLDMIFNQYNPAKYAWGEPITVKRETMFGTDITSTLTYEDYLDLFPEYQLLPPDKRAEYGSDENIAKLKDKARLSLKENGMKYAAHFVYLPNVNASFLSRPIAIEDVEAGSVVYKVGYRKMLDGAFHGGTDIPASKGVKVYAVSDAKVIYVQNGITESGDICMDEGKHSETTCGKNFAGNQIILQIPIKDKRNDIESYLYVAYFHLNNESVRVHEGDSVTAGDYIGDVGETGMAIGSHLHIQGWIDTEDGYHMPYSTNAGDIGTWQKMIDVTMFCDDEFRNHIYGR